MGKLTRIMAIDPSLTRTGICAVEFDEKTEELSSNYAVFEAVEVKKSKRSIVTRSLLIMDEIIGLIDLINPNIIIIEIPEGRISARHAGGGAGLAKYGFCVGMVYGRISGLPFKRIVPVGSSYWTQGFGQEKRRKKALTSLPALEDIKDPGYDISDAAALSLWWVYIGRHKNICLST